MDIPYDSVLGSLIPLALEDELKRRATAFAFQDFSGEGFVSNLLPPWISEPESIKLAGKTLLLDEFLYCSSFKKITEFSQYTGCLPKQAGQK